MNSRHSRDIMQLQNGSKKNDKVGGNKVVGKHIVGDRDEDRVLQGKSGR